MLARTHHPRKDPLEQSVRPFDRDRGETKAATSMGTLHEPIRILVLRFLLLFFFYLRSYCRNISVDIHPVAISKYDECAEDCATIRFTLIDDNRSEILIFVSVMRLHRSRYL